MKTDSFAEQYKHPKWQKKRLEILKRDNFECRLCTDTETKLDVHHINYEKAHKPWEYPDDNFTTLCSPCHEHIGKLNKLIRKAIVCRYEFFLFHSFLQISINNPTKDCAVAVELISENPSVAGDVIKLIRSLKAKGKK